MESSQPSFHEAIEIWEHFYVASNIVSRNTEELISFFRRISIHGPTSTEYLKVLSTGNKRDKTKESIDLEVNRLVLNYLTSIATLVDFSRNTMRHYEGTATKAEYDLRTVAIREHGLGPLLIRLRAHVVHRARLPWGVRVHLDSNSERLLDVVLDRSVLFPDKDISGSARRFLESFEEDPPFVDLIIEYGNELADLNSWLWGQIFVLYPQAKPSSSSKLRQIS